MFDQSRYLRALTTAWLGRRLDYHETVGSTMDVARLLAEAPGPDGLVVLAEEQTAGRGRRGRSFYSPRGQNLYFTIILEAPAERLRSLPVVVPVAVVEAIADRALGATIKWPNDIWLGERKCCGMLIDIHQIDDRPIALVGIGINVNGDPAVQPDLAKTATSIAKATGTVADREALLAAIMNNLEPLLGASLADVHDRYAARSNVLGREVVVHEVTGGVYEGTAVRLAPTGALIVRRPNGDEVELEAADVSVRPQGEVRGAPSPTEWPTSPSPRGE
ncbi:MAG: biotin--[acetyl-CoA-carboxylase] ligase [Dehalococcoidia bacterium]